MHGAFKGIILMIPVGALNNARIATMILPMVVPVLLFVQLVIDLLMHFFFLYYIHQ